MKRSQSKKTSRNRRKKRGVVRESPSGEHDEIVPSNGASSPVQLALN